MESKRRKIEYIENKDFLDLKEDEIYYFSYAEDLDEINKILNKNITFYGSASLMGYTRIFVNDVVVSLEYEPVSTLYGIVIKLKKDDFNKLFSYENNLLKSKIIERYISCDLYNNITNKVENHTLQISTFMKIGSDEELKLKRMPTIEEMLKIRSLLDLRHKIDPYIYGSSLHIKGYNFLKENIFDICVFGIFKGNSKIEITKNI